MGKKRLREMSWDDYGISIFRYKELQAFCMQYDEKKAKIDRGISGLNYDGISGNSGKGDALEKKAIRNAGYEKDCRMIEQAAVMAAPEFSDYIIASVTKDMSYSEVMYDKDGNRIPVGKTDFYAHRRLFYHLLDSLKI